MRRSWRPLVRWLVAALVWLPSVAHAQGTPTITVTGMRGLLFGTLIPGVQAPVQPTDVARAAWFDVRAAPSSQLQLVLALPLALQHHSTAEVPLRYGPAAAAYSITSSTADAIAFDPAIPFTVTLPASGRVQVYLGATALPPVHATAGRYTAVITLTAAAVGN
ncbi:MAG: hypothetical protein SFW08_01915 [Gemmatimonadaceae bacterium]|nr:hypothetical protein [Gemmatimonadaceae bacterium]